MKDETVWLTSNQMSNLFGKNQNTINEHINNIFKEGELDEKTSTGISGKSTGGRKPKIYNLDVIISVGYRVKSKNGIIFRKWANKVLKDYLIQGYAINQKRLEYLEKTIKLIDIANRMDERLEASDAKEVLKVIGKYTKALDLLDDYDHRTVKKIKGNIDDRKIEYDECLNIINTLRFNEESKLFAVERDMGLKSIIGNIYQTFGKEDLYKSVEEKAANFLYLIVKNHVFVDGNKRIAATMFIYFLNFYSILYKDGRQVIDNNTLTALTLLIAESNPKEKEILVDLVTNFLSN
ncbi:MAG: virulence protein RhuM/Fic/DOC family protein [Clostridia bacterium]|nr:virulence protein RhuM/Fic/DOC family protein [Clostridia bacterium]